MKVSINCDMGESFGLYKMGDDEAVMPYISIANVACGFHASDPVVIARTVALAKEHGVKVGAHPSLPDLQGFGRREMRLSREELSACIIYQVGALKGFLEVEGMPLNHIKPHGALYGMAAKDENVAHAICDGAQAFGVPLLGMAGTVHEKIYTERRIPFISEFYCDLDYSETGHLIITKEHEAKDPSEAIGRVLRAVREGKVKSVEGPDVDVRAECVCVHSDTPNAIELAKAIYEALGDYLH